MPEIGLDGGDAVSASRSATLDGVSTVSRAHANAKSVLLEFVTVVRLVSSFHEKAVLSWNPTQCMWTVDNTPGEFFSQSLNLFRGLGRCARVRFVRFVRFVRVVRVVDIPNYDFLVRIKLIRTPKLQSTPPESAALRSQSDNTPSLRSKPKIPRASSPD